MKSPQSSLRPKKRKLLVVRRVSGRSMMPYLNPGQIVIGHGLYRRLQKDDVIIFWHNDREKIKRITVITDEGYIVEGDNKTESTDSRHFGPVVDNQILAKVIS